MPQRPVNSGSPEDGPLVRRDHKQHEEEAEQPQEPRHTWPRGPTTARATVLTASPAFAPVAAAGAARAEGTFAAEALARFETRFRRAIVQAHG